MNDIQTFGGGSRMLSPGDGKRVARTVSRGYAIATVRCNDVQDETDVMLDKLDALTTVAGHAMGGVVRVAQAQQHMEALAPAASGRLALLADNHAVVMAEMQADHSRVLRRK